VDVDALYGLPLERFVPERDALAKALRAEGRREDAARVAKLRKPTVAAWAVNQLVRTQGRTLSELLDAGAGHVSAHAAVVSGTGDGHALREAAERERTAVEALVETARGLLTSDGHELSPAVIDRVADTLHAAALEEGAREQVRHGRLERERRHVGLGAAGVALAATPPAPKASEPKPELTAARKAARAAEAEARRRFERAERALRAAREARDRAAERLKQAQDTLGAAQAEADAAAEAHRQASEQLGP
jgi:hypothetical protein